jgi:hypothetical protein
MDFTEEDEQEAHTVEHDVEQEAQGQGAAQAEAIQAKLASAKALTEQIEKIKARVLELMGEAARNQYVRNGAARRP